MKCEEFRNIVFELASGELTDETAEAANRHMADCPQCRMEYEEVMTLTAALRDLRDEEAPASILPNVMNKIYAEKKRRRVNAFIRFGTAAAAAVVLVVGAVNVLPDLEKKAPADDTTVTQDVSQDETTYEDAADAGVNEDNNINYLVKMVEDEERGNPDAEINYTADTDDGSAVMDNISDSAGSVKAEEKIKKESGAGNSGNSSKKADEQNQIAPRMTQPESVYDDSVVDIMVMSETADEDIDETIDPHSGGDTKSFKNDTPQIITAGIGNGTVVETVERSFIRRSCRFIVDAGFAEAAQTVDPKGKSMARVSAELSALGVEFEVYITEDDYTAEYKSANAQRKAEIEALCETDNCSITIK